MINLRITIAYDYLETLDYDELATAKTFVDGLYNAGLFSDEENLLLRGRINDLQNQN
jgi:hypothetical protein